MALEGFNRAAAYSRADGASDPSMPTTMMLSSMRCSGRPYDTPCGTPLASTWSSPSEPPSEPSCEPTSEPPGASSFPDGAPGEFLPIPRLYQGWRSVAGRAWATMVAGCQTREIFGENSTHATDGTDTEPLPLWPANCKPNLLFEREPPRVSGHVPLGVSRVTQQRKKEAHELLPRGQNCLHVKQQCRRSGT